MAKSIKDKNAAAKRPAGTSVEPMSRESSGWTFFTNHGHVLILLNSDPDIVVREIAQRVGITERAVQRIIQDLVDEGFIERERVGRRNRYRVMRNKYLRHPIESHCRIDDLVKLIVKGKEQ